MRIFATRGHRQHRGSRANAGSLGRGGALLRHVLVAVLALGLAGAAGCGRSAEDLLGEARALQDVGEFRSSIDPLRQLLQERPDHPEANYRLGLALAQTGQESLAVWPLERAAAAPEQALPANQLLASIYLRSQAFDLAVQAADRVLEIAPEETQILALRAGANLGNRRFEAALADAERLLAVDPENVDMLAFRAGALGDLGRLADSEQAFARLKQVADASGDEEQASYACAMAALFHRNYAKDETRAETELRRCLDEYPEHAFIRQKLIELYDDTDQPERALALLRSALEGNPEDLATRAALANRLRNAGRPEDAERLMVEATERPGRPARWLALADYYRAEGESARALEAFEEGIEEAGGVLTDEMRFRYADTLADAGELERAEETAKALSDPVYRSMIQGRIRLERGDAAGAAAVLDPAVQQWPDNVGARYLLGLAARDLGDTERAISQLREAVRIDETGTDAAALLAEIYFSQGDYDSAASFARNYIRKRQPARPDAYALWIRALTRMGQYDAARRIVAQLEETTGARLEAALERAGVERAAQGPAAAARVIETSGLDLGDPANAAALRFLAEDLLALGRSEEALARVESALAAQPESASLVAARGQIQARAGRRAEARKDFERALALDPEQPAALTGLATLAGLEGDLGRAVELFDRAAAADPGDPAPAYAAAQLVLAGGDKTGAEKRLGEIVRAHRSHAGSRNDLAWILAEQERELDRALRLASEAARLDPSPAVLDTLGFVHLRRGEHADATEAFEQALEAEPDSSSFRYHLGLALARQGKTEEARAALRKALGGKPFPEAEEAKRELARLEAP